MGLLGAILSALAQALFAPLQNWWHDYQTQRQARRQGRAEAEQQAADAAQAALDRQQQARTAAPATPSAVIDKLKAGRFCLLLAMPLLLSGCFGGGLQVRVICGTVKIWTPQEQRQAAAEIEILQRVQPGAVIPYMMMDYGAMRDEARACKP